MKHFERTAMMQLIEFIEINNQAPLNIVYKKARELLDTEAEQHQKLLSIDSGAIVTLHKIRELLGGDVQQHK
jgi:hypothetical protein